MWHEGSQFPGAWAGTLFCLCIPFAQHRISTEQTVCQRMTKDQAACPLPPQAVTCAPTPWTCQEAPRPWAGKVGLEQVWAPSPQPLAQCLRPHHRTAWALGPWLTTGDWDQPQNRTPLMVATKPGWEEASQSLRGGGGHGSPYHPVPSQERPRGEKGVASCPRQSRLSPSSGAQAITGSSPSLPLWERRLP